MPSKPNRRSIRRFLADLLIGGNRHLTPILADEQRRSVLLRRAEFANDLLGSIDFQEAIQAMNEEVVAEIVVCPPLDKDQLSMLQLRLLVISDFQTRLIQFVDEYGAFMLENDQKIQRQNEQQAIDRGEQNV